MAQLMYCLEISPEDADRMTNPADPDKTGSVLVILAFLPEILSNFQLLVKQARASITLIKLIQKLKSITWK